jgi:hypothetical protein
MPVTHIVLLKLKAGVTEGQLNNLYEAVMSLGKLPMVQSVSAGENFSARAQGYTWGFVMVLSDLQAYQNDPHHAMVRDQVISPLVAEGGYLSVDYEFPRGVALHKLGKEVATPDLQRWDPTRTNEDLNVQGTLVAPKSDGAVWRTLVAAKPIREKGYVDFVIDRNPKAANRGIQIGVIGRADLEGITAPGKNFVEFKTGFAWQCNGGYVSGIPGLQEPIIPHTQWEHDHTVGVFVDLEKGLVQFFFDRKKIGPAVHLKELGNEAFWAISVNTPHCSIDAKWTAVAPKVFLA